MKTFDNLAQRGIYYFIATTPKFAAVKSDKATAKQQESAYNFIKGIYLKLFDNPEITGMKIQPDDCLSDWWNNKEKPQLKGKIRNYIKNINTMIEMIYKIVYFGNPDGDKLKVNRDDFEIKPAMVKKLANFEITAAHDEDFYYFDFPKGTVKGLKLLAFVSTLYSDRILDKIHNRSMTAFTLFSRGVFNPELPYTAEIYRGLYGFDKPFNKLNDYFVKNGFHRLDNREYKMGMHSDVISLDYLKFYGEPEGHVDGAWKIRNMSGISMEYHEASKTFMTVGVRIPFFREVLTHADKMSESLKQFLTCTNKCSYCGYCSKGKPPKFIRINDTDLCTLFTFGYCFADYNDDYWLADNVIELMELVDELFADRKVELCH
jgi:hypothetical protein